MLGNRTCRRMMGMSMGQTMAVRRKPLDSTAPKNHERLSDENAPSDDGAVYAEWEWEREKAELEKEYELEQDLECQE